MRPKALQNQARVFENAAKSTPGACKIVPEPVLGNSRCRLNAAFNASDLSQRWYAKYVQGRPKSNPRTPPNEGTIYPQTTQKLFQKPSKIHPTAPKSTHNALQERPRAPKSAPRVLHEGPKSVQDRPKSCPRAPKGAQKGYQKLPNRTKMDAQTPKKSMLKTTYF